MLCKTLGTQHGDQIHAKNKTSKLIPHDMADWIANIFALCVTHIGINATWYGLRIEELIL
jgi:hypothetical protein